jgi:hypothetical protein
MVTTPSSSTRARASRRLNSLCINPEIRVIRLLLMESS